MAPTAATPRAETPIPDPGPPPPVPAQLRWHRVSVTLSGEIYDVLRWAGYPMPIDEYVYQLLEHAAQEIVTSPQAQRRSERPAHRKRHVLRLHDR